METNMRRRRRRRVCWAISQKSCVKVGSVHPSVSQLTLAKKVNKV